MVGFSLIRKKGKVVNITIRCQSLSFVVTRFGSLSLAVIRCHSLFLLVPLVVIRCHYMNHSSVFL